MMPGLDRRIDPATRDYISDGSGGYEKTRTAETAVYHQMRGNLGQWALDPDAGGRLYELARAKSGLRTPVIVADMLEELLKPLVREGLIGDPTIIVERELDRIADETTVVDLTSGEQLPLVSLIPYNP